MFMHVEGTLYYIGECKIVTIHTCSCTHSQFEIRQIIITVTMYSSNTVLQ